MVRYAINFQKRLNTFKNKKIIFGDYISEIFI